MDETQNDIGIILVKNRCDGFCAAEEMIWTVCMCERESESRYKVYVTKRIHKVSILSKGEDST